MTEPAYLQVAGWEKFQNADVLRKSGGRPPWIKLYTRLLDDPDSPVHELGERDFGALVKIWLLAAKTDNKIRNDSGWVRSRIGARRVVSLSLYVQKGFLEPWTSASTIPANQEEESRMSREGVATETRLEGEYVENPLTPAQRGDLSLRDEGQNPRSRGTNPRARAKAGKKADRDAGLRAFVQRVRHEYTPFQIQDELIRSYRLKMEEAKTIVQEELAKASSNGNGEDPDDDPEPGTPEWEAKQAAA